jgi:hypothetical protein
MSLTDFIHPVSSQTDGADEYDHAIVLVDATKPAKTDPEALQDDGTASVTRAGTGSQLGRRWTKNTLREELVRRKYAKWQEDKTENTDEAPDVIDGDKGIAVEGASAQQASTSRRSPIRTDRLRDKNPFKKKKGAAKKTRTDDTYVDTLYENQRGWFTCGIPLYSGRSLLPIDPSAWQTASFKYSPVNITNAQLPDPSWVWAWRTWYVDMSYDVDEEGWQYSFSFGHGWAWHGTHPWFHSFVRRRRWLRKRVKLYPLKAIGDAGDMKQAHLLNEDYFTIHATVDRSRDSSADRTVNHHSSFLSHARSESDSEDDMSDVSDILKLMGALKRARVDREKMWAVRAFLNQGGDDIFYLADRMDDIMNQFIYRTSRRQLQSLLLQEYRTAKIQKQRDKEGQRNEGGALAKKQNCLLEAVRAADAYMESKSAGESGHGAHDPEASSGSEAEAKSGDTVQEVAENENINDDSTTEDVPIEGISEEAGLSEEPVLRLDATENQDATQDQDGGPSRLEKGKEKA